jgi:hypothetical protein
MVGENVVKDIDTCLQAACEELARFHQHGVRETKVSSDEAGGKNENDKHQLDIESQHLG